MKNRFFIGFAILVFVGCFTVTAQENVNQFDANGKRTGIWKKYHTNKRIRYEGQFIAGKETGVFKFYSPLTSDHPITIRTYEKNSDVSKVQFYTVEGVLESEGFMKAKNRIGTWKYYHPDGKTLMIEEQYLNGMLDGKSVTYFDSGKIAEEKNYKMNLQEGLAIRYDSKGVLISKVTYEGGKLNGPATYYTVDGKIKYQGNYENDKKIGQWEYYENGKLKKVEKS